VNPDPNPGVERLIARQLENALEQLEPNIAMPAPEAVKACSIVVPIYNGALPVWKCLASLQRFVAPMHRIILADDCSPDLELAAQLAAFARANPQFQYCRRPSNLGYLANVNAAIAALEGDVLLLNSDTEIGPECVERLQRAAYSGAQVAAACPLSDNATLLSLIPANWLAAYSTESIQRACIAQARARFPQLPTLVGFCLYLRRDALRALGCFDPFFAPGYGEEDDFAQRARAAGWHLVAAPDVFVRHSGGESFGRSEKVLALQRAHAARLSWRWPNYESDVRTWWRDWPLREHAERVRLALCPGAPTPRILHVLHRLTRIGGTENFAHELMTALAHDAQHTVVAVDPVEIWADCTDEVTTSGVRRMMFNASNIQANQKIAGLPSDLSDPALERSFARLLSAGRFDLVHVHHLAGWNSLLIPSLARALGVPVVFGLHCHFALCPDPEMFQLPSHMRCPKVHAEADATCERCISTQRQVRMGTVPAAIAPYLTARSVFWRRLLADCDVLIAPSQYLANRVIAAFPETAVQMQVIPHGVGQELASVHAEQQASTSKQAISKGRSHQNKLHIGFLGGNGARKGFALVRQLAAASTDLPLYFTCFGAPNAALATSKKHSNLTLAPTFAPSERAKHLQGLDLILLPSLVAETFSLVLSEANALTIPVIAANSGAFQERITHGVNGFRLDADDPEAWLALLRKLCTDAGREQLRAIKGTLLQTPLLTMTTCARQYLAIYQTLRAHARQAIEVAAIDAATNRLRHHKPVGAQPHPLEFVRPRAQRQAAQVIALARDDWGQSQYRVHIPLAELAKQQRIEPPAIWRTRHQGLPELADIVQLDADAVLFLHSVDAAVLAVINALRAIAKPPRLVFLLDDLLTADTRWSEASARAEFAATLRSAIQLCDVCICTSAALADHIGRELRLAARKFRVVPNALSGGAWQALKVPAENTARRLRVLWAGGTGHDADLDLLLPVIQASKTQYQWVFFGQRPSALAHDGDIEFHSGVAFADYPAKLAQLHADIALAPLQQSAFNQCKSPLKLLEYGALALPVIASAITPYLGAPVLFAKNTTQWLDALETLSDANARSQYGQQLSDWVRPHQLIETESNQLLWMNAIFGTDRTC
jgi:GT2 family glycosyltransferase/glycosyltransferase involved in cell wall biosynthesis